MDKALRSHQAKYVVTSININPDEYDAIGENAFDTFSSLTEVTIPEGITRIDREAFSGCWRLKKISLPKTLRSIGSEAFAETGLESIEIPEGVTEIGDRVFYLCDKLEKVVIPSSVMKIGKDLFIKTAGKETATTTIYGEAGSFAESYANENGIPSQVVTRSL